MTHGELVLSLPEWLRKFRTIGPFDSLEDANRNAAYFSAVYQEAIALNEELAKRKRTFISEQMIGLALIGVFRKEFGEKTFEFSRRVPGLRLVTENLEFTDVDLTLPLVEFTEQLLRPGAKRLVRKIGDAAKFCRLDDVHGVDMKGFAEDWVQGFSVRFVRAYDISSNSLPCRLDALVQ